MHPYTLYGYVIPAGLIYLVLDILLLTFST